MNRIVLVLDTNCSVVRVCSDEPVEVYFVSPHTPHDRVYLYGVTEVGPQFVRAQIGGYAVGHVNDGTIMDDASPVSPRLPPSKPTLGLVPDLPAAVEGDHGG